MCPGVTIQDVTKSETIYNKKKSKVNTFKLKLGNPLNVVKFDPKIMDLISGLSVCSVHGESESEYGVTILNRVTIIDTGANVFATVDECSVVELDRNCSIQVEGSTGLRKADAVGESKLFGGPIVLIRGLTFDIASL